MLYDDFAHPCVGLLRSGFAHLIPENSMHKFPIPDSEKRYESDVTCMIQFLMARVRLYLFVI